MITDGAVLFYDGSCGLCAASVRFILRHERPRRRLLRFAPLEGPSARALLARHAHLAGIDSIVLVTPAPDDLIARHRHKLLPSAEACELPAGDQRARFIP